MPPPITAVRYLPLHSLPQCLPTVFCLGTHVFEVVWIWNRDRLYISYTICGMHSVPAHSDLSRFVLMSLKLFGYGIRIVCIFTIRSTGCTVCSPTVICPDLDSWVWTLEVVWIWNMDRLNIYYTICEMLSVPAHSDLSKFVLMSFLDMDSIMDSLNSFCASCEMLRLPLWICSVQGLSE